MKSSSQEKTQQNAGNSWVLLIICLGVCLRLIHLLFINIHSPFYFGGLYYEFALQIAQHDFALPSSVPYYTDGGLPYAYPPLAFYLEAVLISSKLVSKFVLVNLLPPLLATLSVSSFYVLLRCLSLSSSVQKVALAAYALMPLAIDDFIEAAGLAESLGIVIFIWFLIALTQLHERRNWLSAIVGGIAFAGCVLAAPGTAYALVPTVGLFCLVVLFSTRRDAFLHYFVKIAVMLLLGLILTLPFFITVISNHGIEVFTSSFGRQHNLHPIVQVMWHLSKLGTVDSYLPWGWMLVTFLGLIHVFLARRRGYRLLGIWFFTLYLIPREGFWLSTIPLAIIIGLVIVEVIFPVLRRRGRRLNQRWVVAASLALVIFIGVDLGLVLANKIADPDARIPDPTFDAFAWLQSNTPPDAKILISHDPNTVEWLPQIARRTVVNTIWGAEWRPDILDSTTKLDEELEVCEDNGCVVRAVDDFGYQVEDVWFFTRPGDLVRFTADMDSELAHTVYFQNETVSIFRFTQVR